MWRLEPAYPTDRQNRIKSSFPRFPLANLLIKKILEGGDNIQPVPRRSGLSMAMSFKKVLLKVNSS